MEQIYIGICKYGKKIKINNDLSTSEYVICTTDYVSYFLSNYSDKKLIVLNIGDNFYSDDQKFCCEKNVCVVLDHHKTLNSNNKIISLLNYGSVYKRLFSSDVLPIRDRLYDVIFLGGLSYSEKITKHRKDTIDKIKSFCDKYKYKTYVLENDNSHVNIKNFHKILRNTKIFVSPFGWGEWSTKDYECICLGCHVFVPNLDLESYPNHYKYFDCFNIDFSDFDEKLLNLLQNLDLIQEKVNANRQIFLSYHNCNQIHELEQRLFPIS